MILTQEVVRSVVERIITDTDYLEELLTNPGETLGAQGIELTPDQTRALFRTLRASQSAGAMIRAATEKLGDRVSHAWILF